jgi:hypothetical protein
MTHSELIEYFGSGAKAATALGVGRAYVCRWKDSRIPDLYQAAAHSMSNGKLMPDQKAIAWVRQHFPNGIKKRMLAA